MVTFPQDVIDEVDAILDNITEERHHCSDMFYQLSGDWDKSLIWSSVSITAECSFVIYRGDTLEVVEANRALFRLSTTYTAARRVALGLE